MATGIRRQTLFVLWSIGTAIVLLEVVLRMGAFLVQEEPTESSADPLSLRVLALGDSWVYGAEAPKGQGFIDVVAQKLPELSNGRSVQMFNHGRNGSNTAHVALTAIDQMKRLQPELLIVLVGQNNASNFYRVAEVEERLGRIPPPDRLGDQLRVVKLARILFANYRGSSDYLDDPERQQLQLPEIPEISTDEWGNPIAKVGDLMQTAAAQGYVQRQISSRPEPTGNQTSDLAWDLLYSATRRDFIAAEAAETSLLADRNWTAEMSGASAPDVGGAEDVLARYALMRLARERGNWRGVRYHGGALLAVKERSVLSDLGAAEASLLAGDWRRARALLTASHNRLPGFLDTIDMAARFTPQARDALVYEALEFQPIATGLAHERARFLAMTFDYEGAAEARREWLTAHPEDLAVAADQASWLVEMGRPDEAEAVMKSTSLAAAVADGAKEKSSPHRLRYTLASLSESGQRQGSIDAVERALKGAQGDAALLGLATRVLSSHEDCEKLPSVAAKWYLARGDANGYAEQLSPCMPSGEAAHHLAGLREEWGPLGDPASWTALVKAGHRPFALLYRDLDLVLDAASETGAQVLLLNYPNPSEDHVVLRDVISDYSSTRAVHYLDLWSLFDARFSAEEWQEHLGPNGHCNADGYRVMAEAIIRFLRERRVLAGAG